MAAKKTVRAHCIILNSGWTQHITKFAFIVCFVNCFQLASKKGGLGAQKVSSKSFSELEKKAQAADKLRENVDAGKKSFEPEESMCVFISYLFMVCKLCVCVSSSALSLLSAPSLRLACKDLEQQRKMEEKKLKGLEGKKKEQAERLGMGLGMRRYDGGNDEETDALYPGADFKILAALFIAL